MLKHMDMYQRIFSPLARSVLVLFAFAHTQLQADSTLHTYAGFESGYGTYRFEEKLDHTVVYPVGNLMLGATYQRFNYSLNLSGSLAVGGVSEESYTGSASRQDIDLTIAYQISKGFSAFAGYKFGRSDVHIFNYIPPTPLDNHEFYLQQGPFLGINYNLNLEAAGKLSFSLAYAALAARNKFIADGDGVAPGELPEFDDYTGYTSGYSSGYSYSIGWSKSLQGQFIFRTRLRVNHYDQDIRHSGLVFNNISEGSTMLMVGITYIFKNR
ncbi:MAG: hypothetical protein OEX03_05060 [Gammaproteobacteria bacterium]|nr:hypothetical protein [Gammaproteobacteria bacterium]